MAESVYLLCALTSIACTYLLWRSYFANRTGLLLWSGLCFAGLAVTNVLLFVDLVLVPTIDLSGWRNGFGLGSVMVLLFGLVWEMK